MLPSAGFTGRLTVAIDYAETKLGPREHISQTELGEMVSTALGKKKKQTAVSAWTIKGVRNVDTIWALAIALGVRPAWLAFGEEPMVEHQELPPGVQEIPVEAFERMPRHIRRRKKA